MKNYPWIFLSAGLLALVFAPGACGGGSSGGAGGGTTTTNTTGTGGTGTTSTTTTTTTSTTSGTGLTGTGGVGGGTGGSGGGITISPPACDAPATPPSGGSCHPAVTQPPACPHPGLDGGTMDAGSCSGVTGGTDACSTCLEGACCDELQACLADQTCLDCATGNASIPSVCETGATKAELDALLTCPERLLHDGLLPADVRPGQNEGCDSGQAARPGLDQNSNERLLLLPGPERRHALRLLRQLEHVLRGRPHPCADGAQCYKYCCTDADCGTGKCDTSLVDGKLGLCTTM